MQRRLPLRPAKLRQRGRQQLKRLHEWGGIGVGAILSAARYYCGRVIGRKEPAPKAQRRFDAHAVQPSTLLCIYRRSNESTVAALVAQARQRGMTIALWALDAPLPQLAEHTVGQGPGLRMELLNRLWRAVESADCHQLVVADDDFTFTRGSLDELLAAAMATEFGIAQPTHDWRSQCNYFINRRRPFVLARQTTFVEPGPLFVVTRPWIGRVVPFPDDFGMGWGIWLQWQGLQRKGCRLGVVDCVSVNHPFPVAREYAPTLRAESGRLKSLLRERGFDRATDAQQVLGVWRMGQPRPPWMPT